MTFAYRQDFGFGNPNMAGALFAVLVLSVFLGPAKGRWMGVLRFLISGIFFGCLLLTASRGALVGLALGSVAAWFASGFPRPKSGLLVLACAVIISATFGARAIQRMGTLSASEGSTASRIAIYRCVPAMVMAAPGGWGRGRAASTYENWFQDPKDTTPFKNLLSTHATWIVERGILFFACYAVVWILALRLCNPVALGVLITWGTCCAFSHVGGAWWMWIVPALAVCFSLNDRWKQWPWAHARKLQVKRLLTGGMGDAPLRFGCAPCTKYSSFPIVKVRDRTDFPTVCGAILPGALIHVQTGGTPVPPVVCPQRCAQWLSRSAWVVSILVMLLLFFLAAAIGRPKPDIHYDGRIVRVGSGPPALWFLAPDISVMGKTYGKNLRALGNIAVAQRWDDVRSPLVLSGNAPNPSDSSVCENIIWLNPPAKISPRLSRFIESATHKTILWGALRSDANPVELRAWFDPLPNAQWVVYPGRAKYLGDVLGSVTKL